MLNINQKYTKLFSMQTALLLIGTLLLQRVNCEITSDEEEDSGFDIVEEDNTNNGPDLPTKKGSSSQGTQRHRTQAQPVRSHGKQQIQDDIDEYINENMEMDLSDSIGADWGDLATTILNKAWANNGNKTEVAVLELMKWFEYVAGEERLYLLRLLELMDKDMNGFISKEEFVSLYAGPLASPDSAIELLHRLNDYDGNGYISVWETLTQILTVDGINRDIYDRYQAASYSNRMQDTNNDFTISLTEFINYFVFQVNLGLGVTNQD